MKGTYNINFTLKYIKIPPIPDLEKIPDTCVYYRTNKFIKETRF